MKILSKCVKNIVDLDSLDLGERSFRGKTSFKTLVSVYLSHTSREKAKQSYIHEKVLYFQSQVIESVG